MLLNLHVKNFALIDEIDVDFSRGLNILTGETGAGKSIILGSLGLALGAKADKDCIRSGCEFALFEITFSIDDSDIKKKLEENDISYENDEILIQRKITAQRSVFKINSQTVNAAVVKDIASSLIDIYGQHDYRDLLNSRKHIEILDSFSVNDNFKKTVSDYKNNYSEYLRLKGLCESPEVDGVKREREISLLEYQINEIDAASLKEGEEEEVEEKLIIQENASRIQNILGTLNMVMYEGEGSASEQIDLSIRELSSISSIDEKLSSLFDELNDISSRISDFERENKRLMDEYCPNEEELFTLRERFDLINELERKYGNSIEEVLKYCEQKRSELEELTGYEENRKKILEDYEKIQNKLKINADKLSKLRKENALKFEKAISESLMDLNFSQSDFKVCFLDTDGFTQSGTDKINFEISTNKGEPLKPLENVSSGGELSRIMLSLKTVGAEKDNIDTLIFDEIDSGISGVTAWKVAKKLALLSKDHQVICITHLQQIAAMADIHYEIVKTVSDESRTNTFISVLDEEGRIKEICRMLGDEFNSDKFRDNALEIIKQAREYKNNI